MYGGTMNKGEQKMKETLEKTIEYLENSLEKQHSDFDDWRTWDIEHPSNLEIMKKELKQIRDTQNTIKLLKKLIEEVQ